MVGFMLFVMLLFVVNVIVYFMFLLGLIFVVNLMCYTTFVNVYGSVIFVYVAFWSVGEYVLFCILLVMMLFMNGKVRVLL